MPWYFPNPVFTYNNYCNHLHLCSADSCKFVYEEIIKGRDFSVHDMKVYRRVVLEIHPFLNSAVYGERGML